MAEETRRNRVPLNVRATAVATVAITLLITSFVIDFRSGAYSDSHTFLAWMSNAFYAISLLLFMTVVLTHAKKIFLSPLISIVFASLGWASLSLPGFMFELLHGHPWAGGRDNSYVMNTSYDMATWMSLRALLGFNALAMILMIIVLCRRPTVAFLLVAPIVSASAFVALGVWYFAHLGL